MKMKDHYRLVKEFETFKDQTPERQQELRDILKKQMEEINRRVKALTRKLIKTDKELKELGVTHITGIATLFHFEKIEIFLKVMEKYLSYFGLSIKEIESRSRKER